MRIISGKYKGRVLNSPKNDKVRPTSDMVKGAVFSILSEKIEGCVFLDLFAGSGGMGIEALSRGAKKSCFVDSDSASVSLIRSNLAKLPPTENYEISRGDFKDAIRKFSANGVIFDIIYCDPPYGAKDLNDVAEVLREYDVLSPDGIIIFERDKHTPPAHPQGLIVYDSRTYGRISLDFCKKGTKAILTGTFDPFTKGHLYLLEQALKSFDAVYTVVLNNPSKVAKFSKKERLAIIKESVEKYSDRVFIDAFEGLTIDYCKQNGIQYIIRGSRNPADMAYEMQMAEYNFKNGGIYTLIYPAKDCDISSTLARRYIDDNMDLTRLLQEGVIKIIKKEDLDEV